MLPKETAILIILHIILRDSQTSLWCPAPKAFMDTINYTQLKIPDKKRRRMDQAPVSVCECFVFKGPGAFR